MSADDEIQDSSAPLIEHLAELRQRLIYSFVAFIIGMIICFTIWNPIFDFLTHPLCSAMALRGHSDCGLILIKLQEGFFCSYIDFFAGRSGLIISYNWVSNVALCGSGVVQNREERLFTLYCRIAFYVFSWRIFCVLCSNSFSF